MKRLVLCLALFATIAHAAGGGMGGGGTSSGPGIRRGSSFNEDMIGLGKRLGAVVNGRRSEPVPPGEFTTPRHVSSQGSRIYGEPPEGTFTSVNLGRTVAIADGKAVGLAVPYAWRADPAGASSARIAGLDRYARTLLAPRP